MEQSTIDTCAGPDCGDLEDALEIGFPCMMSFSAVAEF